MALGFEGDYDWWYKAERTELPSDAGAESLFAINDHSLFKQRVRGTSFSKPVVLLSDTNKWEWQANEF